MKILHIANISNDMANGVNVVVPQHVASQSAYEKVWLYNVRGDTINGMQQRQLAKRGLKNVIDSIVEEIGKIDLVVFHEINYIEYISIYNQLLKRKIPYIIVPHGEIRRGSLKKKWLKKKVAYMLLFNRFIRKARAVQCLSQAEKDDITIKTPPRFVVGNGISLPIQKKQQYNKDKVKIVYIGRIEIKVKGIDMLCQAVDNQRKFCEDKNVFIQMYGPDICGRGDEVRGMIDRHNLSKFMSLSNSIFGEEKRKVLLDADLFIQTSRHEGLPVGILEAMSYGLPCIVTKGTSLSDFMIENNAGYYAGTSVEGIEKAIIEAVNDRQNWEKKGQNARKAVEESFLWENIAKKELEEYKRFL